MAYKIALTAGHFLGTPGKRCKKSLDPNETREWVLNDRIADKVEKLLQNYTGWELIRTDDTTGKKDISLNARTNAANNFKADFYLSIHHNAGVNGGKGGGIVAYVYSKTKRQASLDYQKDLYDALIAHTGLKGNRSQPLSKANFHELRESNMPAVLLELGFMDSSTDVPIILSEKFADECAEAIVEVLARRGGLDKKVKEKSVTEIANEVIAGKWGVGEDRKKRLTNAGYDYTAVQKMVNELLSNTPTKKPVKKTVSQIADEVIAGKWGVGADRKKRLTAAGYDYNAVQKEVNRKLR